MWLRLTELAKKAVAYAQAEDGLKPDLVVLACLNEHLGVVEHILSGLGVDSGELKNRIESLPANGSISSDQLIDLAEREARGLGSPYIGPEHLLLGVLRRGCCVVAEAISESGATYEKVRHAVALMKIEKENNRP